MYLVGWTIAEIVLLFVGVDVPHNVVRKSNDLVSGAFGHLCKALGLCLVLEGVGGEVDSFTESAELLIRDR